MNRITSIQTNEQITLPEWENGLTKDEYESLVEGLKKATDSNIDDFDSKLTASIDDLIGNLPLFGFGVYYGQAYKDIIEHHEVKPEPNIARIDSPDSDKKYIMSKAGELLARDIEGRILRERSK